MGGEDSVMTVIEYGVVALAIGWILWYLVHLRKQLLSGAIIVPQVVTTTPVFALCIVVVILTGVSPLHLIWLFPVSFLIAFVLLLFPLGIQFVYLFVALLMGPVVKRAQSQTRRRRSSGRRRKKSRRSARQARRTRASRRRGSR